MKNLERRKERIPELIEKLRAEHRHFIDLTPFEEQGLFFELKGALVTDWANGKIYCNISQRASKDVFTYLIKQLNEIAKIQGSNKQI